MADLREAFLQRYQGGMRHLQHPSGLKSREDILNMGIAGVVTATEGMIVFQLAKVLAACGYSDQLPQPRNEVEKRVDASVQVHRKLFYDQGAVSFNNPNFVHSMLFGVLYSSGNNAYANYIAECNDPQIGNADHAIVIANASRLNPAFPRSRVLSIRDGINYQLAPRADLVKEPVERLTSLSVVAQGDYKKVLKIGDAIENRLQSGSETLPTILTTLLNNDNLNITLSDREALQQALGSHQYQIPLLNVGLAINRRRNHEITWKDAASEFNKLFERTQFPEHASRLYIARAMSGMSIDDLVTMYEYASNYPYINGDDAQYLVLATIAKVYQPKLPPEAM